MEVYNESSHSVQVGDTTVPPEMAIIMDVNKDFTVSPNVKYKSKGLLTIHSGDQEIVFDLKSHAILVQDAKTNIEVSGESRTKKPR